jgi:DNA repair exonuclease SbcCD ATPase subunit
MLIKQDMIQQIRDLEEAQKVLKGSGIVKRKRLVGGAIDDDDFANLEGKTIAELNKIRDKYQLPKTIIKGASQKLQRPNKAELILQLRELQAKESRKKVKEVKVKAKLSKAERSVTKAVRSEKEAKELFDISIKANEELDKVASKKKEDEAKLAKMVNDLEKLANSRSELEDRVADAKDLIEENVLMGQLKAIIKEFTKLESNYKKLLKARGSLEQDEAKALAVAKKAEAKAKQAESEALSLQAEAQVQQAEVQALQAEAEALQAEADADADAEAQVFLDPEVGEEPAVAGSETDEGEAPGEGSEELEESKEIKGLIKQDK